MKCPFCGYAESKVLDTRSCDDGSKIRRRRECLSCAKRFTSYETIELLPIIVIKRDNTREPFDRNKLMNGILRACQKRPISVETVQNIVDEIEYALQNKLESEVSSSEIGEMTMEKLKSIDDVAYVRFASVYRQFGDLNTFMKELKKLIGDEKK